MPPTPPNMRYAEKLVLEIRRRIDNGTFTYADFFPDSPRARQDAGDVSLKTFGDKWLKAKGRLASATKSQYGNALAFWYEKLGEGRDVRQIAHGDLAALVGSHPWPSPKLCNNYLIPLRGLFALAVRDLKIADPTEGIENGKVQKKRPDPFSMEEMHRILADLGEHYDIRVWAYFAYAFATGMRPEEEIAQQWADVDEAHGTARVERAKSFKGELKPIKTYQERDVDLVDLALAAIEAMRPYTFMKGEFIFENPVTGEPWHDERSQRDHYLKPTLKRLRIRARRAYATRHTYATTALMHGANPAYIARQMGHKNAKMLFEIYARWLDGADRGREKAKIEAALRGDFSESALAIRPGIGPGQNNNLQNQQVIGRRDWIRTTKTKPPHRGQG